jgi:hypothetical protein
MTTRDVLRLLHHELGATPVDPALYACPVCGTPTQLQRRGDTMHATLCLDCTKAELARRWRGHSRDDDGLGLTRNVYRV